MFFTFRYFRPLLRRIYSIGIKKNNRVQISLKTEHETSGEVMFYQDNATFFIETQNAFCVIHDGHIFPVFSDFVRLKVQKPLKQGKNTFTFQAIGIMKSHKIEHRVNGNLPSYKSVNTPKKHVLKDNFKVRINFPNLVSRSSLTLTKAPNFKQTIGKVQLKNSKIKLNPFSVNLNMSELEKELDNNHKQQNHL